MGAPKLRLPMQTKGAGNDAEARTVTPAEHHPVSHWHNIVRWWNRHHLTRENNGEWADGGNGGWGSYVAPRSKKSYRERQREIERDNAAVARHAQVLREENAEAHRKGSRERADFYGSAHGNGGRDAERMVRGGGTRSREQYEAEQRDADERRRNHPYFRPRGKAAR